MSLPMPTNKQDAEKAWIETFTGKKFYLLEPRIEDIDVLDIAHSLALQCRWTGHCKYHYSIAQHSWYCSFIGPENEAFHRLNHDDSEAFISDLSRPLKHYTSAGEAYRAVEEPLQSLIYNRFGLSSIEPSSVKIADNQMLYAEKRQLMGLVPWDTDWTDGSGSENLGTADVLIEQWSPAHAEDMFLQRFQELYNRRIN
jgi:5'-deoxynucleotidase YfbR-like HD superfamily hydrolase